MNNENKVSEAVSSILDIEHSTADLDVYKGKPMFVINKSSRYPFSFGVPKAKLLIKHLEKLKRFAESDGQTL
jgi:hypothetical protein